MNIDSSLLGDKVRGLRKELNLTQSELAGEEFTSSYISLIEKGKVNPSLKALNVIAAKLHKPLKFFLDREDDFIELYQENSKKVEALISLGENLISNNRFTQARDFLNKALSLLDNIQQFEQEHWKGLIYKNMGIIAFKTTHYRESIRYFTEAEQAFLNDENQPGLAFIYNALGVALEKTKKYREALKHYSSALDLINEKEIEDPGLKMKVLFNLGNIYSQLGELNKAEHYLSQAGSLSKQQQDLHLLSSSYMSLGMNAFKEGNLDKALTYSRKSMELSETIKNLELVAGLKTNLGMVFIRLGKYNEAQVSLQESLQMKDNLNKPEKKASTLIEMARLFLEQKNYQQALDYCYQSFQLLHDYPDPLEEGKTNHIAGSIEQRLYQQTDNDADSNLPDSNINEKTHFTAAEKFLLQAEKVFKEIDEKRYLAEVYSDLGNLYSSQNLSLANKYFKKSLNLYQKL